MEQKNGFTLGPAKVQIPPSSVEVNQMSESGRKGRERVKYLVAFLHETRMVGDQPFLLGGDCHSL